MTRSLKLLIDSESINCILSTGQLWNIVLPRNSTYTSVVRQYIRMKMDYCSTRLLDIMDMPKQFLHLDQYKIRFKDRRYMQSIVAALIDTRDSIFGIFNNSFVLPLKQNCKFTYTVIYN